jgi:hypothetical protein
VARPVSPARSLALAALPLVPLLALPVLERLRLRPAWLDLVVLIGAVAVVATVAGCLVPSAMVGTAATAAAMALLVPLGLFALVILGAPSACGPAGVQLGRRALLLGGVVYGLLAVPTLASGRRGLGWWPVALLVGLAVVEAWVLLDPHCRVDE